LKLFNYITYYYFFQLSLIFLNDLIIHFSLVTDELLMI